MVETERTKSVKGNQAVVEMTPEQIQQQNILRLNGSSSTVLRNTTSDTRESTPGLSSVVGSLIDEEEETSEIDRFGLKGLFPVLKQSAPIEGSGSVAASEGNNQTSTEEYNLISKGMDLNMLGLDLSNSSGKLSKTFASPWLETSRSEVEPLFHKPQSFNINSNEIPPLEYRISALNDQTLFYIFYTKPRDILQELAARELNKRNWRYHVELQVWLTKDSNCEPKAHGIGSEEGTYIFFDPVSWELVTKSFVLYYNSII